MNIAELLRILKDDLETAPLKPMTNKVVVDRDKYLDIIIDIMDNLPNEILEAQNVINDKKTILDDAHREADSIVEDANLRVEQLVEQDEVTKMAYEKSEQLLKNAQHQAEEIRMSANEYVEDILADLESYIQRNLDIVRQNRSQMRGD